MTIIKAIEILSLHVNSQHILTDPDLKASLLLAIQAFHRIQNGRLYRISDFYKLLQGETLK